MLKNPNVKIFVSHHKPWYIYKDNIYIPIQVWKKNAEFNLWIIWDDTWDNISYKNNLYAELTAQYRVWKNYNLSKVDYIWFCHYRRYLTFWEKHTLKDILVPKNLNRTYDKSFDFIRRLKFLAWSLCLLWHTSLLREWDSDLIAKESSIIQGKIWISHSNIYLPKSVPSTENIFHNWQKTFWIKNKELRKVMVDAFYNLYPMQWEALKKTENMLLVHRCNIFIMDKNSFYEYSNWLFKYLFELEKHISKFDTSKELIWSRFLWAISEYLLDLRLNAHQKKPVTETNLIHFNI